MSSEAQVRNGIPINAINDYGAVADDKCWHLNSYTAIPNIYIDKYAAELSGAELQVLLYIVRRTLGFRKMGDYISYSQFLNGIVTRDGRRLDNGCGLKSRGALSQALKKLVELDLIGRINQKTYRGNNDTTLYWLNPEIAQTVYQEPVDEPEGV